MIAWLIFWLVCLVFFFFFRRRTAVSLQQLGQIFLLGAGKLVAAVPNPRLYVLGTIADANAKALDGTARHGNGHGLKAAAAVVVVV